MNDKELDQLIKASLTEEEAAYYEQLDEQNLFDKMTLIYSGKMRWISVVQTLAMIFIFFFGVYAAIQFYKGTEVVHMMKWGFAAMLALVASSMVKLYLIQFMLEKSVKRDLKRLELQLSHLAKN